MATIYKWTSPESIPPREFRGDLPIEHDRNPVEIRGETLGKVLWRGRIWAVTEHGIERLDGAYFISAAQLNQRDLEPVRMWPMHMSGKSWMAGKPVDHDDFLTAWLVAIALHGIDMTETKVREAVSQSIVHDRTFDIVTGALRPASGT